MILRVALIFFALICHSASAMTVDQRKMLDLSTYVVTDPDAGFLDVSARHIELLTTSNPILLKEIIRLQKPFSCESYLELPILDQTAFIPISTINEDEWRRASEPYRAFEDAVMALAAKAVLNQEDAGVCLIRLLDQWAQRDAFPQISQPKENLQVWFQIETSISAAALAYSLVRNSVNDAVAEKHRINTWLNRAAKRHLVYPGGPQSCCNNHLYRRAVYATMIGVLTSDNDLFRIGIAAVYSALSESASSGALPRELLREDMAAHYQNFATMYLVTVAQIVSRQGYDLFSLELDGKTLGSIITFTESLLEIENGGTVAGITSKQRMDFADKKQYIAWLELVPERFLSRSSQNRLVGMQPVYSRTIGGNLTLFFADSGVKRD